MCDRRGVSWRWVRSGRGELGGVVELAEDVVAVDDRVARWRARFDDMFSLVAGRFAQADSRRRARMYLLGLLSGAERKNSWTLAEQAGDLTPNGMQRLRTGLLPLGRRRGAR